MHGCIARIDFQFRPTERIDKMAKIQKEKIHTYISLFSCAGIGCLGFTRAGFKCIATNELLPRRLDIQRHNKKCDREEGYIQGDITLPEVKQKIFSEIAWWQQNKRISDVDVVVATPHAKACQFLTIRKTMEISSEILLLLSP